MFDWLKILQESPVEWLLEKSNPSVRYFTLRDLLAKPEDGDEIVAAKKMTTESPIVTKILHNQNSQGYLEDPNNPYLVQSEIQEAGG
jgi:hypothetical protein